MEKKVTVSVVLSVYNGEIYLPEAIESILGQTFTNFEFIIIDDGSTDNSLMVIQDYAARDDRIRVVVNEQNIGLAKSLNKGVEIAKGKYIARMDADDISLLDRLEKQVDFLDCHQEISVLGGSIVYIDETGKLGKKNAFHLRPAQIKWNLFFGNPIAHPTSMFRRDLFWIHCIRYNESLATTQDFDLWVQIAERFQIANLPDVLLYYRQHDDRVSHKSSDIQRINNQKIRQRLISTTLKISIPIEVVQGMRDPFPARNILIVLNSIVILYLLLRAFRISTLEQTDQELIKNDVAFRLRKIILNSRCKCLIYPYKIYALVKSQIIK